EDYAIIRLMPSTDADSAGKILDRFLRFRCEGVVCLKASALNASNSLTQVSEYRDEKLFSTGKEGYLLYGPYRKMRAGHYRLTIQGAASGTAHADIVSSSGKINHGRFG